MGGGGGTFWKTSWVGSSKACIRRARGIPRWERAPFWLGEAAEQEKRGMSGVSRQGDGTLARSLVPLSCCSLSLKGRLAELLHY